MPTDGAKRLWPVAGFPRTRIFKYVSAILRACLEPGFIIRPVSGETMSVKRYKLALPTSSEKIRQAKTRFKAMTKLRKIELMVEAGVMTKSQAKRAKKKLEETPS